MEIRCDQGMVHGLRLRPPDFFSLYCSLLFKLSFSKAVLIVEASPFNHLKGFQGQYLVWNMQIQTYIIHTILRQERWTYLLPNITYQGHSHSFRTFAINFFLRNLKKKIKPKEFHSRNYSYYLSYSLFIKVPFKKQKTH